MTLLEKVNRKKKNSPDINRLLKNGSAASASDLQILLKRERARTDRTGLPFSQILFECKRLNHALTDHIMRVIYSRVRFTDEVRWLNNSTIAIVLPDTSSEGARALANSILGIVETDDCFLNCKIYTYPSMRLTNGN